MEQQNNAARLLKAKRERDNPSDTRRKLVAAGQKSRDGNRGALAPKRKR